MPACDDAGVSAEAAFVAYCAEARCIDAIKVGCMLLHRSLPEAELLTYVVAAGLPMPEVNHEVEVAPGVVLTPDQWFSPYEFALEYEGSQHQEERGQYNADIDRCALYRRHGIGYEQVTKERLRSPKATVRLVHQALVERGYVGPAPDFDGCWLTLFSRLADLVRPLRAS